MYRHPRQATAPRHTVINPTPRATGALMEWHLPSVDVTSYRSDNGVCARVLLRHVVPRQVGSGVAGCRGAVAPV